jgi:hypothetical protein
MSGMPWIKIYTDMLDDFKVMQLTDAQKWRFVQLILLAATCDAEGAIVTGDSPVTPELISKRLYCDLKTLKKDIEKLLELGLVTYDGNILVISKFADRQGPTQEEKRKQWRERQKKRRDRATNGDVTGESRVSPPLEEEEEEEVKSSANANGSSPPKKPRGQSEKERKRNELIKFFLMKTGLLAPRIDTQNQIKAAQKLWWSPADETLEMVGWDVSKACVLVDAAVTKLRKKEMTISDFNSIIKTVRAEFAEYNQAGG